MFVGPLFRMAFSNILLLGLISYSLLLTGGLVMKRQPTAALVLKRLMQPGCLEPWPVLQDALGCCLSPKVVIKDLWLKELSLFMYSCFIVTLCLF